MSFHDDYFRRLLEELSESGKERVVEERHYDDRRDTLRTVDQALADKHRFHPERLNSTLDRAIVEAEDPLSENLDDLFEMRTTVCRRLERSDLDEEVVFFLIRSVYVGTQRLLQRGRTPSPPAQLMAELLRQERIAHVLDRVELAEAWRVLFELEADRDHYSFAEDYLFHAVRLAPQPDALIQRGLDFYERLLELPDDRLEAGDLTRREAERARWELLEKLGE